VSSHVPIHIHSFIYSFIHSFIHSGSIVYLGSMSIAVNSPTGPAVFNLPATFSKSGIIPTIATMVFVCILSATIATLVFVCILLALCCLHMANTISKVARCRTITISRNSRVLRSLSVLLGPKLVCRDSILVLLLATSPFSIPVPLSIRRTWWIPFWGTGGLKA
jgi:hypothetical protein